MAHKIRHVAVIGSGTMGNGIAHCFAQYGYTVSLADISEAALERGIKLISGNLDRQISSGIIGEPEKRAALNNIQTFTNLEEAVRSADLAVEASSENEELKFQIFKDLSRFCKKGTILATNTSSISITKIAEATSHPELVIGMHFMNPVPVMKLVEVITGSATSSKTTSAIMDLSRRLDKIPVEVKDYPGFVANRILMPMINEAIYALYEGVAGVNEIDTVMKLGMGHPMGPLQLADLIGLDVCLAILNVLYKGFENSKYAPCPLLVSMVDAGNKGKKTGKGFYEYK